MIKVNKSLKWLKNIPINYNGKLLCFTNSSKKKIQIDIWLINHSFYNNSQSIIKNEGQIKKFMNKYQLTNTN